MRLQAATSRQCAPHCARSQQAGTRWAVAGWCRRQVEGKLVGEGEGGRGKEERQGVARALGVVTISLLKLCTEIQMRVCTA